MSDPFQRAKDIRSGKLDAEMPSYEELTGWLQRVPMTWLPGLLIRVVKLCVLKKVFASKEALIKGVENVANAPTDGTDVLRDTKPNERKGNV